MSMARYRNRREPVLTVRLATISRALWAVAYFLAGALAGSVLL